MCGAEAGIFVHKKAKDSGDETLARCRAVWREVGSWLAVCVPIIQISDKNTQKRAVKRKHQAGGELPSLDVAREKAPGEPIRP